MIVDEAYVDFGTQSALPLIEKYENLLVVQTFSKSRSMAGMRIGFALACPKLIKYLNDVKYSFNSYTMNRTSIAAGVAAIKDQEYFLETCGKIIETREWTKKNSGNLDFTLKSQKQISFLRLIKLPGRKTVSGIERAAYLRALFSGWKNR